MVKSVGRSGVDVEVSKLIATSLAVVNCNSGSHLITYHFHPFSYSLAVVRVSPQDSICKSPVVLADFIIDPIYVIIAQKQHLRIPRAA